MTIAATSDLHGYLPDWSHIKCDVFCICGDTVPLKMQSNVPQSRKWFRTKFIDWCNSLDCKVVLLIAGNHDIMFERLLGEEAHSLFLGTKIKYLENEEYCIDGKVIYGTPYCKEFGNWAFMRDFEHLLLIYSNMPSKIDLLLTHDAPYGVNDIVLDPTPWTDGSHIGNPALAEEMQKREITYNIHGHLHSTLRNWEMLGNTKVRNVSAVDEQYRLVAEPFIFEL